LEGAYSNKGDDIINQRYSLREESNLKAIDNIHFELFHTVYKNIDYVLMEETCSSLKPRGTTFITIMKQTCITNILLQETNLL
jgi:hypothetical protein